MRVSGLRGLFMSGTNQRLYPRTLGPGLKNRYQKLNVNEGTFTWLREVRLVAGIAGLACLFRSRIKGNSGEIRTGVPYKIAAASDGSPSAASKQPHLVTTTHWTTSFR